MEKFDSYYYKETIMVLYVCMLLRLVGFAHSTLFTEEGYFKMIQISTSWKKLLSVENQSSDRICLIPITRETLWMTFLCLNESLFLAMLTHYQKQVLYSLLQFVIPDRNKHNRGVALHNGMYFIPNMMQMRYCTWKVYI